MENQGKLCLLLYGAGGHAAVVESAVIKGHDYFVFEILDDSKPPGTRLVRGRVLGGRKHLAAFYNDGIRYVHVAIGDNAARENVTGVLEQMGFVAVTVQHPAAIIEEGAQIEGGTFLAAGSIVGARAQVGRGCIINTGASVDHDCRLEPFVHVCPGARLAGTVQVGTRALIGAGATVIPGMSIGADAIIGAGAVVIRPVPAGATVVGNPARILKTCTAGVTTQT
jgi:sugar O-acyltransferase (sialic acid O-acetyltransferase NeuD family)